MCWPPHVSGMALALTRSVKDGKREGYNPEDDEDLHCLISADNEDRLQKGVEGAKPLKDSHSGHG